MQNDTRRFVPELRSLCPRCQGVRGHGRRWIKDRAKGASSVINSTFKPRRSKPRSHKWLWELLDILTSKIVRLRMPFCCTCGTNWELTCSHIFSRGHGPTRFDIDPSGNNQVQCSHCNNLHNTNKGPLYGYFVSRYGERALDDLARRAVSEKHWSYLELGELAEGYKLILATEKAKAA
jgi:hypothetical protein